MASLRQALSKGLKEIRIHLCPKSAESQGVRSFVENHYVGMKKANPNLPILVREAYSCSPRIFLRFDQGIETKKDLASLSSEEVTQAVEHLLKENSS